MIGFVEIVKEPRVTMYSCVTGSDDRFESNKGAGGLIVLGD